MKKRPSVAFAFVGLIAACGGSGGSGEELVGAWGGPSLRLTFHAGGALDIAVDGSVDQGTWEVDGDRLTLEGVGSEIRSVTMGYLVHDDMLLLAALFPDGATDGVVGTWTGEMTEDGVLVETTLEVVTGGTGHITATSAQPSEEIDADLTWELDSDLYLRLAWNNGDGSSTLATRMVLPDVAVGGYLLGRAAP